MARLLKTKRMTSRLISAMKRRRKVRAPWNGLMTSLGTEIGKDGWYYQCDLVHDKRIWPKPYVVVWAFAPGFKGNRATHYLASYS